MRDRDLIWVKCDRSSHIALKCNAPYAFLIDKSVRYEIFLDAIALVVEVNRRSLRFTSGHDKIG